MHSGKGVDPADEADRPESGDAKASPIPRRRIAMLLVAAVASAAIAVAWAAGPAPRPIRRRPRSAASASAEADGSAEQEVTAKTGSSSKDSLDQPLSKTTPGTAEDTWSEPAEKKPAGSLTVAKDAALAAKPKTVAQPVRLEQTAHVKSGTATIARLEAIDAKADGIGEIAGPAIRFVLEVHNTSQEAMKLDTADVTVEAGSQRQPAIELKGADTKRLPQGCCPGQECLRHLRFPSTRGPARAGAHLPELRCVRVCSCV